MPSHLPVVLISVTVWVYWIGVAIMLWRIRAKFGHRTAARPSNLVERMIWPLWVAVITGWITFPLTSVWLNRPWISLPEMAHDPFFVQLRLAAAVVGILCLVATICCWIEMGGSWRIAVIPGEKTKLITTGLYAYVRHPIYALSICLMLATVVIVPSPLMIVVALIHFAFMHLKSLVEERSLLSIHGTAYEELCERTGRYFPRWSGARSFSIEADAEN